MLRSSMLFAAWVRGKRGGRIGEGGRKLRFGVFTFMTGIPGFRTRSAFDFLFKPFFYVRMRYLELFGSSMDSAVMP
jgi:hypothetical protein